MHPCDILTPHLRLVSITLDLLDVDEAGDTAGLARLLQAVVPPEWPPEHWEPHVFPFFRSQFANHPHTIGWSRYVVTRHQPTLIGTLGGFPRTPEEAEIGYGILPPWQRKGFATEGLRALLTELFREPGVILATAQTFPHLAASLGVLAKCGFQAAGEGDDPGAVRFRLNLNSFSAGTFSSASGYRP
jgi:[ribosomal protein S5]-alanine N-acetyltransferase